MKRLKQFLPLFILVFILAACTEKSYPPVPQEKNIIVTINIKDMTISFVDADNHQLAAQWEMEKPYSGGLILPDNDTLLLFGKHVETVDLYSLSKGKRISSWKTGKGIANGELLQNEQEIVFADQKKSLVRFFTIEGNEIKAISTKQNPFTILEGENKLYIVNISDGELTIINKEEKVKLAGMTIHRYAAGALLREAHDELWLGGHGTGTEAEPNIHVYNLKDGTLKGMVYAPLMPVNFVEKDGHIFAISHGSNTLYKISAQGEVMQSLQIGANPFELAVFHDDLIVAGYDSDDIYFVDPDSLRIKQRIEVGKGPFQLIVRESKEDD